MEIPSNSLKINQENEQNEELRINLIKKELNFLQDKENPIEFKRHFGKNIPFCFKNGEPLFTIGPHCIFFQRIYFNSINFKFKGFSL